MATMAAHNNTDDNGRRSNGSVGGGGSVTAAAPAKPASSEMPSRNPLPLSASQEAQVREVFNKRVRDQCADEIKGE